MEEIRQEIRLNIIVSGRQTFSIQGQIVNTLGFVGPRASVITAQIFSGNTKAAIDSI